jgi:hypothetical protein
VKEQMNWAQNSFLEREPSWIVVMSRMLVSKRKKLQSFTNWTTTHIWHGLFFKVSFTHRNSITSNNTNYYLCVNLHIQCQQIVYVACTHGMLFTRLVPVVILVIMFFQFLWNL